MDRRLYNIWSCMRQRCNNPKHTAAKWYHYKGIRLCEEWESDFEAFKSWAISNGYRDDLTIDRVDPDKNYCPENCRWISLSENSRRANKGKTKKGVNRNGRKATIDTADRRAHPGNVKLEAPHRVGVNTGTFTIDAYTVKKYILIDSIVSTLSKLPPNVEILYLETINQRATGFAEGFAAGKAHAENKPE